MPRKISITDQLKEGALELELDGETFTLTDLTQAQMEEADRIIKEATGSAASGEAGDSPRDPYTPHRQLAYLLGAPQERFLKLGWRAVNLALTEVGEWLVARRGDEGKADSRASLRSRGAS